MILKYILASTLFVCLMLNSSLMTAQQITRIEYFFDYDPGFGNGISASIIPDSSIQNHTITINYSLLSPGFHTIYIRSI